MAEKGRLHSDKRQAILYDISNNILHFLFQCQIPRRLYLRALLKMLWGSAHYSCHLSIIE